MEISIVSEIRSLIGSPPVGYEFLEYFASVVVLIFLVCTAYSILKMVFSWIGGGL